MVGVRAAIALEPKIAWSGKKSRKRVFLPVYRWDIADPKGERQLFLYGLKTCDTCRKALKSLPQARFVDVRAQGVPADVMARALDVFGSDLVNKRSTTWRGLSASDRGRAPSELLAAHPTLMKRPLIVRGEQMWLGWSPQTRAALACGV
jgi:arsenate reductase-like glutaredoxin family protein